MLRTAVAKGGSTFRLDSFSDLGQLRQTLFVGHEKSFDDGARAFLNFVYRRSRTLPGKRVK